MLLYTIVPQKYQSQHISIDNNTLHVYENKSTKRDIHQFWSR